MSEDAAERTTESSIFPFGTQCFFALPFETAKIVAWVSGARGYAMVELTVSRAGTVELVYVLKNVGEATEYIVFLRSFWDDAEFLLQPLRH